MNKTEMPAAIILTLSAISAQVLSVAALADEQKSAEPVKPATTAETLHVGVLTRNIYLSDEKVNRHFTPVPIPCHNKVRGLVLSGKAEMVKIRQDGSAVVGGETIKWHCRFLLSAGTVLITAEKTPILVKAGSTVVFMDAGSTAVIYYGKNVARCANLSDRHKGSMKVMFGKHFLDLDPGREVVLVKESKQNPLKSAVADDIGWQDLQQTKVDGICIFSCKVSGKDILKVWEVYRQLTESPLAVDHSLRDQLLKTVAALDSMYDKHVGPFALTPYKYGVEGKPKEPTGSGTPPQI